MYFNPHAEQTDMMFFCIIHPQKLQSYVISHATVVFFNINFFFFKRDSVFLP